jgi:hypothetical protein
LSFSVTTWVWSLTGAMKGVLCTWCLPWRGWWTRWTPPPAAPGTAPAGPPGSRPAGHWRWPRPCSRPGCTPSLGIREPFIFLSPIKSNHKANDGSGPFSPFCYHSNDDHEKIGTIQNPPQPLLFARSQMSCLHNISLFIFSYVKCS